MIEWLGPIVHEYYSATEIYLLTAIDSDDWLAHRGSVGRPLIGTAHILDEDGRELARGSLAWCGRRAARPFEYHNDPEKTAASRNEHGWTTVGDIGYLDEEGYLYLTDRKADMIISGGVNIYPQEAENVLVTHPAVADAAVFGIPHDELGEEVKAVVQLVAADRPAGGGRGRAARVLPRAPRQVQVPAIDRLRREPCRATRRASSTSGCCATATRTPHGDGRAIRCRPVRQGRARHRRQPRHRARDRARVHDALPRKRRVELHHREPWPDRSRGMRPRLLPRSRVSLAAPSPSRPLGERVVDRDQRTALRRGESGIGANGGHHRPLFALVPLAVGRESAVLVEGLDRDLEIARDRVEDALRRVAQSALDLREVRVGDPGELASRRIDRSCSSRCWRMNCPSGD